MTMRLTRAGQVTCALPIRQVVEAMRPLRIDHLAGAPAFVRGLAVIRGVALPFGTAPDPAGGTRCVVIRAGDRHVALAVEAVIGVREVVVTGVGALAPLLATIATLGAALMVALGASRMLPAEAS